MAKDKTRPTGKAFQDVLMVVLGNLSSYRAGVTVASKDTYQPICDIKGITMDQYGNAPNSNTPWVQKCVQEAYKSVVKKGFGDRKTKGQWCLTSAGVAEAEKLAKDSGVVAPLIGAEPEEEEISMFTASQKTAKYHDDPWLLALATKSTPCFGKSHMSTGLCKTCPVEVDCINALAVNLSDVAAKLEAEDYARVQAALPKPRAAAKPKAAPPAPAAPAAPATGSGTIPTAGSDITVELPTDTTCEVCGLVIPKNTKTVWIRSGGATKGPGMYHPACYGK